MIGATNTDEQREITNSQTNQKKQKSIQLPFSRSIAYLIIGDHDFDVCFFLGKISTLKTSTRSINKLGDVAKVFIKNTTLFWFSKVDEQPQNRNANLPLRRRKK